MYVLMQHEFTIPSLVWVREIFPSIIVMYFINPRNADLFVCLRGVQRINLSK